MIGQTLSHFKLTAKLGEGGMGEVYRAEDTNLGREVAIKVLPEVFTQDPERLARFEREAHVLASLNHPSIAAIYDLAEDQGVHFLVLELAEGEDLAARLAGGPVALADALQLALQIAEALEAAHAKGIVHRDLKPANIMVGPDGKIKVLDFGLAKAREVHSEEPDSLSMSPTLTAQMTQAGTILGTAAYMSPEQARGQEADGQTDIWALGVVLYEILTGDRTFSGDTAADTIAAIIEREPDWDALPATTPPLVRSLLRRCLQKDRSRRLHDVADVRLELEEAILEPLPAISAVHPSHTGRRILPWVATATVLGALLGAAIAIRTVSPADSATITAPSAHLAVNLTEGTSLDLGDNPPMAISPNGQILAWAARGPDGVSRIFARRLDQPEAREVSGTESGYGPFFSPDGDWIAYFDQAQAQLKKVSVDGGLPTTLCDAPKSSKGGTWGDRDEIVFSYGYDGGLARVSAEGGAVEMLTSPDRSAGIKSHRFPHFLPGGRAVLFMIGAADIASFDESHIAALDLDTGEQKVLLEGGMSPRYASSGHLVFAREGALLATPFDSVRLELLGPSTSVLNNVVTRGAFGYGLYALSPSGALLYAVGGPEIYSEQLVQADRSGHAKPLEIPEGNYGSPSSSFDFSPSGRRLALTVSGANFDIWLWDFERKVLSRLTAGWNNSDPLWSPSGEQLIFQADRRVAGASDLMWIAADRSAPPQPVYETLRTAWPGSWSPDGRHLAYWERDPDTPDMDYDIWVLPLGEGMVAGTPERLVGSTAREQDPRFSPDGRWLAYSSDETGIQEIYVRPFPGPGPTLQVSSGGGVAPEWGSRSDEIFFVDPNAGRMMGVSMRTTPDLQVGTPEALFDFESTRFFFRLSPDGEHFVFLQRGSDSRPVDQLRIVFNWSDQLD